MSLLKVFLVFTPKTHKTAQQKDLKYTSNCKKSKISYKIFPVVEEILDFLISNLGYNIDMII